MNEPMALLSLITIKSNAMNLSIYIVNPIMISNIERFFNSKKIIL